MEAFGPEYPYEILENCCTGTDGARSAHYTGNNIILAIYTGASFLYFFI